MRAFHRRPQRSGVIQVTNDEARSRPVQRAGGGRAGVAHQGTDRPVTFEQVPRGRPALLAGGADDQHRGLVICHFNFLLSGVGGLGIGAAWP